jgi:hypothetical protein
VCAGAAYTASPNLCRHKKKCSFVENVEVATIAPTAPIVATNEGEVASLREHVARLEAKIDMLMDYIMKKDTSY